MAAAGIVWVVSDRITVARAATLAYDVWHFVDAVRRVHEAPRDWIRGVEKAPTGPWHTSRVDRRRD